MSARQEKIKRRHVVKTLDLTFDKALTELRRQINGYPFKMRMILAWRILWRNF